MTEKKVGHVRLTECGDAMTKAKHEFRNSLSNERLHTIGRRAYSGIYRLTTLSDSFFIAEGSLARACACCSAFLRDSVQRRRVYSCSVFE